MTYARYAVYFTCPPGPLADRAAAWLGWDIAEGKPAAQPDIPGLGTKTKTPRKYGFHGTLKPPFRLADGATGGDLLHAATALARSWATFHLDGFEIAPLGRFLALRPASPSAELAGLAGQCVTELDQYRAPLSDAELARRRARPLSALQEALLARWGYPFVLEEFRFHMTLTGPLPAKELAATQEAAETHFDGTLPKPFPIDAISLCGELESGRFRTIARLPLGAA